MDFVIYGNNIIGLNGHVGDIAPVGTQPSDTSQFPKRKFSANFPARRNRNRKEKRAASFNSGFQQELFTLRPSGAGRLF